MDICRSERHHVSPATTWLLRAARASLIALLLATLLTDATTTWAAAATGTVVAWGSNNNGQTNVPAGLNDAIAIAAGYAHSLALKRDGTVVAWGWNKYGQTNVPAGPNDAIAIAAGYYHSLALKRDGTVVAWGSNNDGQLNVPAGLSDVVAIAAGTIHSVALKRDGTVVAWGNNFYGQRNVPTGLNDVIAIASGHDHNLALKRDGTVVAWGNNAAGQLNVPASLSDLAAIAANGNQSLGLKRDGTVVAWGNNAAGQLNVPAGLSDLAAIAVNGYQSLGLKRDGTVVTWGYNGSGLVSLSDLRDVIAISAEYAHVLALVSADTTSPAISARVVGTRGANGWYTSDVSVSWSVADDETPISAQSGCDPTTLSSDTAGTTLTCMATSIGGTISTSGTIKRDATPPSTSSRVSSSATNWATITLNASDALSGVAGTSFRINGGPTQPYHGPLSLNVLGSYTISYFSTDRAGNLEATQTLPVTIAADSQAPSVTLSSAAPNPTNASPIAVIAQFSENVNGFTAGDITAGNASVVNFVALDNASYTFDLAPSGQGLVTADIAVGAARDAAGNVNTAAAQLSRSFDSSAPSVSIEQAAGQADPAGSSPINFTVRFSEPISGFTDADVSLSGTAGATTAVVSEIAPNDGTTYNVAVSGMATTGTVIASVPADSAQDAAGNGNSASTSVDNSVSFAPAPAPAPDLTIAKRHSGIFTQGQTGAQYTIAVSNVGSAATNGTVQVVDTLPTGLTATALSGTGWNCTLATLSCTRSDALTAGSSYDNITLTVDVASNAPASLTNRATVSSGGEQNTADNTASDPATVTPGGTGSGAQLVADPCGSGATALLVSGGTGNDTIVLTLVNGNQITVVINNITVGTFNPTGPIVVDGQAGNDTINIATKSARPRIVYGNEGDDTIVDDNGRSILIGGAGADTLDGGTGRDILIGGAGADTLQSGDSNDIMIAGGTSYDAATNANLAALCGIQAEWIRTDASYSERVAHLSGATSGGLNGASWLKATAPGQTVFDDASTDALTGADGQDWFLLNQTGGSALDTSDRNGSEVGTDL